MMVCRSEKTGSFAGYPAHHYIIRMRGCKYILRGAINGRLYLAGYLPHHYIIIITTTTTCSRGINDHETTFQILDFQSLDV
jgi:hypothetical protein